MWLILHNLMGCGEFERDQLVLLDDVCRIVGTRVWLDEFWTVDEEGKVALLLGREVEGICNRVMAEVGVCIVLVGYMVAEKEAIVAWVGCCWILILLSPVTSLPPTVGQSI